MADKAGTQALPPLPCYAPLSSEQFYHLKTAGIHLHKETFIEYHIPISHFTRHVISFLDVQKSEYAGKPYRMGAHNWALESEEPGFTVQLTI